MIYINLFRQFYQLYKLLFYNYTTIIFTYLHLIPWQLVIRSIFKFNTIYSISSSDLLVLQNAQIYAQDGQYLGMSKDNIILILYLTLMEHMGQVIVSPGTVMVLME